MRLKDKVAIVTGSARGIGEAVVRDFLNEGAKVIIADILEVEGKALETALQNESHSVHSLKQTFHLKKM